MESMNHYSLATKEILTTNELCSMELIIVHPHRLVVLTAIKVLECYGGMYVLYN